MFFKNISKWSKKCMWGVTIVCYALYFCIVVLAPTIIVMVKYDIFNNNNGTLKNVTGFGLIVIVICGLATYILMKKALHKLPQISTSEQRFKFGLETIFDCIPLGIALYAMFVVKDDVKLAFETMGICMWLFLTGIIFNGLFIKFIDAEWFIRQGAKFDKEKAKRKDVV